MERATGLDLPTVAEEQQDPRGSDARYEIAATRLIELTRSQTDFPLIYAENKNYGFERNLLAMRKPGLIIGFSSAIALMGAIALAHLGTIDNRYTDLYVGLLVVVAEVTAWVAVPNESRVRIAGERYAFRLLDSASRLRR